VAFDLGAYLDRIGLARAAVAGGGVPSVDRLVFAHITTIPFENLDILLGRPIPIDLDSVFGQLVTARRGGYCFQHNALFAAALRALGYRVVTLAGRVGPERLTASRTHMLLEVAIDDRPFIVDVGFGGHTPVRAIPLEVGTYATSHGELVLRDDGDGHLALDLVGFDTLYWFTREAQYPVDYEVANHYTATSPESYFVSSPRLALITEHGYRGYTDGQLSERGADGTAKQTIAPERFVAMLREAFTLEFPESTRFRGVG